LSGWRDDWNRTMEGLSDLPGVLEHAGARGRDAGRRVPHVSGDPRDRAAYLTPAGIYRETDRLLGAWNGRAEQIGVTTRGRPVFSFHFGPADKTGGAFMVSLIHACEWIGPPALLTVAEAILSSRPDVPLSIVPIANPDGAWDAWDSVMRDHPRFVRGNGRGIDLNRNFPVGHRPRALMSALPWYRSGPRPLSEPESESIAQTARIRKPSIALSFHAFGRWFFYPPACRFTPSRRAGGHQELLDRLGGVGRFGYRSRQLGRWMPWFRAYGTEIDFFSEEIGATAFLIELSRGGIGRWGLRRLACPFYWYNPPHPEVDVQPVAAFCARLIDHVLAPRAAGSEGA
jgi:hypothetical protein